MPYIMSFFHKSGIFERISLNADIEIDIYHYIIKIYDYFEIGSVNRSLFCVFIYCSA